MQTALCDASAFAFWRTPPLVRALVNPADDLADFSVDARRLLEARGDTHQELEIWRHGAVVGGRGHPVTSDSALDLLDSVTLVAPSVTLPVDVLVGSRPERRRSGLVRPHVWTDPPADQLVRVSDTLSVTSPAATLLTLAARLPLPRLIMAVTELVGGFSVYRVPGPLRRLIEELASEGLLPRIGQWAPSFDRDGSLTDLWTRPPLATCDDIVELARRERGRRGCRKLERAALLSVPGAASPLEARTGMLLGLPGELGGEALSGFEHNAEIELNAPARQLARRATCRCDLFWPATADRKALDLECQSRIHHADERSALSDADRATALQSMDIDVSFVTYGQIGDVARFDALAGAVADRVGGRLPERTDEFLAARAELRAHVLSDWSSLAERPGARAAAPSARYSG